MADFEGATVDDIYRAFAEAETGAYSDSWIRTKDKSGLPSDAYGPVQILSSTMVGATKQRTKEGRSLINFNDEELKFIDRYAEQGRKFYKHGKSEGKIPDYNPTYDYGGSGDLSERDKKLYESTAKKIIDYELKRVGGIKNLKREWRFGPPEKWDEEDPGFKEYIRKFDEELTSILNVRDTALLKPDEAVMDTILKGVR
tara:strand:- start:42 stop:638 length:597 start_codon:yes stop_codon:yes gene_type:complete